MNNFIEIYEKVFNDEFCHHAIEWYKVAEQGGMTLNRQDQDGATKIKKDDSAVYLPHYPILHTDKKLMLEFEDIFWKICYRQYADKYDVINNFERHSSYTMKIQKTQPGQGYHIWHAEAGNRECSNRILAWTIYLNDDFEAGETEFLYQQYRYKPNKGDCVIFPSGFTHTHRGNPPIGGDKYIITGWVEF